MKFWQFDPDDLHQMSVYTLKASPSPIQGFDGASAIALYFYDCGNVSAEICEGWPTSDHAE